MRAFILSERRYGTIGEKRFLACWHVLKAGVNPSDPEYDFDPVSDTEMMTIRCDSIESAIEKALSKREADFFGAPYAVTEILEWFVREDRVAEWEQVGDSIECSE